MTWWQILIAAWAGVIIALVTGVARAGRVRRAREVRPAPVPVAPRDWSDPAAVRTEFHTLIPDLVTADVFALDALINRKARGAA